MQRPKQAVIVALVAAIVCVSTAYAQQRNLRKHTETEAKPLRLEAANQSVGANRVSIRIEGNERVISSNGLPAHLVGRFPNRGNPNPITAQKVELSLPATPRKVSKPISGQGWVFGISLFGVPFDPFAAEFWQGNRQAGWTYDALGGAIPLGLDENYAHVQPDGTYHYHGIPFGLLELVGYNANDHSPLVGYAADGYPIYALTGFSGGETTQMTSSWRLKSGNRPGGSAPGGVYDGAFNEDYEYVEGLGTLDACNGGHTISEEYPGGTYAYFITEDWPVIPRCFSGEPSTDFQKRRRRQ